MIGPTKKIWALVEVAAYDMETGHGNREPVLIGGVDIERARAAIHDLYRLHVEPPRKLFNTENPMYTAPRRLSDVIREDYKRDPEELAQALREAHYQTIERLTTIARAEEWRKDHPKEYAAIAEKYGVVDRDAYVKMRKLRVDHFAAQFLDLRSVHADRLDEVVTWLRITGISTSAEEISARTMGDDDAPFASEAFLYTLLGKDAARSVRNYLGDVAGALGMDEYQMMTTKSPWEQRLDEP